MKAKTSFEKNESKKTSYGKMKAKTSYEKMKTKTSYEKMKAKTSYETIESNNEFTESNQKLGSMSPSLRRYGVDFYAAEARSVLRQTLAEACKYISM